MPTSVAGQCPERLAAQARAMRSPLLMAEHFSGGAYVRARHLTVIDYEFRALLNSSEYDILIVKCPVRHGKSEYLARWAVAWYLLRHPHDRVMICTNTARLASNHSRWVRDKVHELAPVVGLRGVDPNRSSVSEWALDGPGMGSCLAAGVGGSIVGFGANLLVIDDYLKDAKSAYSATVREAQWDWFVSTSSTRLEPNGKIILLCCLTGDTQVSMADGSVRQLKDVRSGDQVCTFDQGRLKTSRVRNHASVGFDDVFEIELASGRRVRGNARHPFLVEVDGRLEWKRLRNLRTGQKIVALRDSGASGPAKRASGTDAISRLSAVGSAVATTTKKRGSTVINRQRKNAQITTESTILNIATDCRSRISIECLRSRVECVSYAARVRATLRMGSRNIYASTIAMKQVRSVGCFATSAISQPDILEPAPPPLSSLNTSEFTSDEIIAIRSVGREELFDLEVEGTHSFIANGLVSHNTAWHSDDLIGRILEKRQELGLRVRCVTLQALKEDDGRPDALGRAPGEALWPERWPAEVLERRKKASSVWWAALYQGRPAEEGGSEWPAALFSNIWVSEDDWPKEWPLLSASFLDPSKAKNDKKDDYQALVYVGFHGGCLYVDSWIDRVSVPRMVKEWIAFNRERRPKLAGVEANAFQELLAGQYLAACTELGYVVDLPECVVNTVAKIVRIRRLGWWLSKGMLRFRRTASNELLVRMLKDFPNADKDDGPDALEGAIGLMLKLLDPQFRDSVVESSV